MVSALHRGKAVLSFLVLLGVLVVPTSASAEIGNNNDLPYGVSGLATGTQTDSIETKVWAIEQIGSTVYVGGRFLQVTDGQSSVSQPYLAAFDAVTGDYIDTFTPVFDGAIYALQASPDGSLLFVGGDFDTVNGQAIDALVALDPSTGMADTSWSGDINGSPVVRSLDIVGSWLYVGGSFTSVVSSSGNNAAWRALRFDITTGGHDVSWRPVVLGGSVWGIAASPDADRVYLAGSFTWVNGVGATGGFAALEASSSDLAAGVQDLQVNTANANRQYLYDVVVANGLVWVAGSEHFVQALNESDLSINYFHLAHPRGDYQDLEIVGDRVYAGCHCRANAVMESAQGVIWFPNPPAGESDAPILETGPTTWVAAFDAITGEWIESFVPDATAEQAGVWAIHGDPHDCVWFGGDITTSGGKSVDSFIRLCEAGSVDNERPSVPGAAQVQGIGPDSIDLAWNASTDNFGVTGYRIFDASDDSILAEVPGTAATLAPLVPGTYTVYLKAFDAQQNQSYRSGFTTFEITGAAADTERPSVPGSPIPVSIGADWATLQWNASTDNVGVAAYRLIDASDGSTVVETPDTTATLDALVAGTYTFHTRAVDAAGNVSYRSGNRTFEISGVVPDTTRPSVPGSAQVLSLGPDSVNLAWNASTDDVGVAGYRIYDAAGGSILAEVSGTETTLTPLGPASYTVYVKAFDAAGNESYRSGFTTFEITGTAPDTERPTVPGAPQIVSIVDGTVELTWIPATDNVGVAGYRIYDFADNSVLIETATNSALLEGLVVGIHEVYAKALDAAGNESYRSGLRTIVID